MAVDGSALSATIRPASRHELDTLLGWAVDEGWNPGFHDADAYWAADQVGFLVVEEEGQIIAGGSVVAHSENLGFMGMFIVRPESRGQGLGKKLWYRRRNFLKSRLDSDGSIGLDGVEHMQPFYADGGFVLQHRITRFFGPIEQTDAVSVEGITPLGSDFFDEVVAFDARHFGAERPEFLDQWLKTQGCLALVAKDEKGKVVGYGNIRPARGDGYRIGPLFAKAPCIAEALFNALSETAEGANVYIDIPHINEAGLAIAQKYRMGTVFTCGRMYLGNPPRLPWKQIYGITCYELG